MHIQIISCTNQKIAGASPTTAKLLMLHPWPITFNCPDCNSTTGHFGLCNLQNARNRNANVMQLKHSYRVISKTGDPYVMTDQCIYPPHQLYNDKPLFKISGGT